WKELDTLADAITSIEYYLERLGDRFPGDEDILAIAEEAVAALGYPAERVSSEELAPTLSVAVATPASEPAPAEDDFSLAFADETESIDQLPTLQLEPEPAPQPEETEEEFLVFSEEELAEADA